MATVVAGARVVGAVGAFSVRQSWVGPEGVEPGRLDEILRPEEITRPEGKALIRVIAEDVLSLREKARAGRLAEWQMCFKGRVDLRLAQIDLLVVLREVGLLDLAAFADLCPG